MPGATALLSTGCSSASAAICLLGRDSVLFATPRSTSSAGGATPAARSAARQSSVGGGGALRVDVSFAPEVAPDRVADGMLDGAVDGVPAGAPRMRRASSTVRASSTSSVPPTSRRSLEQRRETAQTQLVLDALTVDEALRILGAPAGTPSTAPSSMPSATRSGATSGARETSTRSAPPPPTDDWRAALRAAGVAPPADDVERGVAKSTESRPSKQIAADADEQPVESSAVAPGISAGAGAAGQLGGSMTSLDTLDAIAKHVASCTRCPLYSTATNPVPGEGNPNADFMCVGEAPGATEDETGRPFIGAAGQLLTKILGAIDLKREDVFICNVLKHRPS